MPIPGRHAQPIGTHWRPPSICIQTTPDEGSACITVPNEASTALHEALGFTCVSRFREVGHKFGRWLDVADYELILPSYPDARQAR